MGAGVCLRRSSQIHSQLVLHPHGDVHHVKHQHSPSPHLCPDHLRGGCSQFLGFLGGWPQRNFAVICMTMAEITMVGCFSVPYGLVAAMNEKAAREGKQVSTALQMALLNCCVTVGQQVCTMVLAFVEGYLPLDKALLIGFIVAGLALSVSGVATLFLNDRPEEDIPTSPEEKAGDKASAV